MTTWTLTPSLVRSRFGRRLFGLFVLCSLLPALVLGLLSYGTVTRQLRRASLERLEHSTRLVGGAIMQNWRKKLRGSSGDSRPTGGYR